MGGPPGGGLAIPLLGGGWLRARGGEEAVLELGSFEVPPDHPEGVRGWFRIDAAEGRGVWCADVHWPDEAEPTWAEERGLERWEGLVPVVPDGDGVTRRVRLMVRIRPLGPLGECAIRIPASWLLLPG